MKLASPIPSFHSLILNLDYAYSGDYSRQLWTLLVQLKFSQAKPGASSHVLVAVVKMNLRVLAALLIVSAVSFTSSSHGYTYEQDVYAINSLYVALESPSLPGWVSSGGDPCMENWQGVGCVLSNITSIILNGANLGGELGNNLENFSSIIRIDLSNNHIGGSIPSTLPLTLQGLFLSANQFVGDIPISLSALTMLTALSLNNNILSGELPDSFQALSSLVNVDLSFNKLNGHLPPSMGFLSSLTTLHLQNNSLSGTLDTLQDLTLQELNIENNMFSGPVPEKILNIPNLKKEGNPFDVSIAPLTAPPSPRADHMSPSEVADAPSNPYSSESANSKNFWANKKITGAIVAVIMLLCLIIILLVLCCFKFVRGTRLLNSSKDQESIPLKVPEHSKQVCVSSMSLPFNETSNPDYLGGPRERVTEVVRHESMKAKDNHGLDVLAVEVMMSPQSEAAAIGDQIIASRSCKTKNLPTSVKMFTVASLQEHTNSFKLEYLIGQGILGSVYRAELPNGVVLAVKKLDVSSPYIEADEAFLDLVSTLSKLQHKNIVNLVGYCWEHAQRLLVYEYCCNGTLYDALHSDNVQVKRELSWDTRLHIALGVARSLEFLHESCEPPVTYRNFKSANVLLDEKLSARVSDCGLGSLISSERVAQFSDMQMHSYNDPISVQTDTYTSYSDVYSFGVVMLELFTGRKPYDSSRPCGEQILVEWAKHQLHDFTSLQKMADPSISPTFTLKSMSSFADIISVCVQTDPTFRPPMSDIVQRLLDMFPSTRLEVS